MRKLDEIVREYYIVELAMNQIDNRYPRFLLAAINGLKDLNQDLKSIVTEVVLEVNDNDTVYLPLNYIDYLVIGTVSNGEISSLGLNNNVYPSSKDVCGDFVTPTDEVVVYTDEITSVTSGFGVGGGQNSNGSYKIYKSQNYIALSGFTGTEIVLRYLATMEQVDGNFLIEEYLVEAVKAYMAWVTKKGMRSYGNGDKDMEMRNYHRQKKLAQKRVSRINVQEIVSAVRSGYNSSPGI